MNSMTCFLFQINIICNLHDTFSTGRPKGVLHTTGGYCVYALTTTATTFDIRRSDVYACVADAGWITGHTYIVYGPLLNGCTTFMFESTPMYPDNGRYWDMVQRHKISIFYTAPTAIRSLMRFGDEAPNKYDLSSLRILGTVGEPINPEVRQLKNMFLIVLKCFNALFNVTGLEMVL